MVLDLRDMSDSRVEVVVEGSTTTRVLVAFNRPVNSPVKVSSLQFVQSMQSGTNSGKAAGVVWKNLSLGGPED